MPKFNVCKSVNIHSSLEDVYSKVRDFHSWPTWSPWLISDPDCRVTYGEDGTNYAWEGKISGSGKMEITADEPNEFIRYKITFLKPWKSVSDVGFAFLNTKDGVEAVWTMDGSLPFFMFWMKPMMTTMVSMDFQRGLLMLKDCIETGEVPSKLEFLPNQAFKGGRYIGRKTSCKISQISEAMRNDFESLKKWIEENQVEISGKPFAVYLQFNMNQGTTEFTWGFPTETKFEKVPEQFIIDNLPSCRCYCVKHTGPYRHLGNAWSAGMMHERAKVFRQNKKAHPFELYETDPDQTPENDAVTLIHFPLK